jgi:hypothetical protein
MGLGLDPAIDRPYAYGVPYDGGLHQGCRHCLLALLLILG